MFGLKFPNHEIKIVTGIRMWPVLVSEKFKNTASGLPLHISLLRRRNLLHDTEARPADALIPNWIDNKEIKLFLFLD